MPTRRRQPDTNTKHRILNILRLDRLGHDDDAIFYTCTGNLKPQFEWRLTF